MGLLAPASLPVHHHNQVDGAGGIPQPVEVSSIYQGEQFSNKNGTLDKHYQTSLESLA
jgi:hypothetical protein